MKPKAQLRSRDKYYLDGAFRYVVSKPVIARISLVRPVWYRDQVLADTRTWWRTIRSWLTSSKRWYRWQFVMEYRYWDDRGEKWK